VVASYIITICPCRDVRLIYLTESGIIRLDTSPLLLGVFEAEEILLVGHDVGGRVA
jgi:hypothetical protein